MDQKLRDLLDKVSLNKDIYSKQGLGLTLFLGLILVGILISIIFGRDIQFASAGKGSGGGGKPTPTPTPNFRPHTSSEIRIPVYVHVITSSTGEGYVSEDVFKKQIDWINDGFMNRQPPNYIRGVSTPFQYKLVRVDYTKNDSWFRMAQGSAEEKAAKKALKVGNESTLNIYIADSSTSDTDYAAWTPDPRQALQVDPILDGIVVNYKYLPGGTAGYTKDLLIHEIGHWLSLLHTFEGGCDRFNDEVDDTPQEYGPGNDGTPGVGCPEERDSCRSDGKDPVHNFMDTSSESCTDHFTAGQVKKMDDFYNYFRHKPTFIDGPKVLQVSRTSATIGFEINESTTVGVIEYGQTSSYGNQINSKSYTTTNYYNPTFPHLGTITDLKPNTEYHYRVRITDHLNSYIESADQVFTTSSSMVESPISCTQEIPGKGQLVSGTNTDVRTVNNKNEEFVEVLESNKRVLEHSWKCSVNQESALILGLNGYGEWLCTEDSNLDPFIFEYSSDSGGSWHDLAQVRKTWTGSLGKCKSSFDINSRAAMLPSDNYGDIIIRVRNKDRTTINPTNLNKLSLDYVGVLAVDAPNVPRLWAAVDADEAKGDEDGLYWSDDLGTTWTLNARGLPNYRLAKNNPKHQWNFVTDPASPAYRYASSPEVAWSYVGANLPKTIGGHSVSAVLDLRPHPVNGQTAIIVLRTDDFECRPVGDCQVMVSLYRTTDGGATWQDVWTKQLTKGSWGGFNAEISWDAVSPYNNLTVRIVKIAQSVSLPGDYLISGNGGISFTIGPSLPGYIYVKHMFPNAGVLYANAEWSESDSGYFFFKRSVNGGSTWTDFTSPRGFTAVDDLNFVDGSKIAKFTTAAMDSSFFRSVDSGQTWDNIFRNNIGSFYCSPSVPKLCVGTWGSWSAFPHIFINYDVWRWPDGGNYLSIDAGPPMYRWFTGKWYAEPVHALWIE